MATPTVTSKSTLILVITRKTLIKYQFDNQTLHNQTDYEEPIKNNQKDEVMKAENKTK